MRSSESRVWIARFLIGLVLFVNIQSALAFFISPARFAPAYELFGVPGQTAIRGIAILFLMWNVPYVVALIDPFRYRISLYEAIVMQGIGLVGETFILWTLPIEHTLLRGSILRFILFDGAGLGALVIAAWVIQRSKSSEVLETSEL